MIPSRPEYAKSPPQTSGCSYLLIEKSPKTTFYIYKNLEQDRIQTHFVRIKSRLQNILNSGHFEVYLFNVLKVKCAPGHPD
jgi:hypothetical protein